MLSQTILTILSLSVLLAFCSHASGQASNEFDREELAVYNDWLRANLTTSWKHVYLMQRTGDYSGGFDKSRHTLEGLKRSTLKDYRSRNIRPFNLPVDVGNDLAVTLLPISLIDFLYDRGGYIETKKSSGAEMGIAFSRVGFDRNRTQALLHVDYKNIESPKWTFGFYFLLVKYDGAWVTKRRAKSWEY